MTKFTLIAAAVAAITTGSAIADTTLYGRARMGLLVSDGGDNVGLKNDSSRLGFKGSEDLGGGLSAIYHYEFGYNADAKTGHDLQNRIGVVGLKGGFGTFTMGNQWVPTYNLVNGAFDPFNHFGLDDGYQLGSRMGNTLAYSNKFGSVDFAVAVVANEADNVDLIDKTNVAFRIPMGAITLSAGMYDDGTNTGSAVGVMYKGKGFTAGVQINNGADLTGGGANDDVMTVVATMNTGSGKVLARFSDFDLANVTGTTLGYHHNLSKRTQVYVENSSADLSDGTIIGLKHNF